MGVIEPSCLSHPTRIHTMIAGRESQLSGEDRFGNAGKAVTAFTKTRGGRPSRPNAHSCEQAQNSDRSVRREGDETARPSAYVGSGFHARFFQERVGRRHWTVSQRGYISGIGSHFVRSWKGKGTWHSKMILRTVCRTALPLLHVERARRDF